MTFASDKLYNDVIKKMLAQLASKVKVREIVPHLPCLTLTDREEIEAKREVAGNYNAMTLLVDCLRRRDNWPEEFISALHDCEQFTLADEIRNSYDKIKGITRQRPAPSVAAAASGPAAAAPSALPPAPVSVPVTASAVAPSPCPVAASVTTVTTATIHKAPHSTPPLLTPSPVETPDPSAVNSPPESLRRNNGLDEASVSAPEAPAPPPPKPAQPAKPSPPVSASPAVPPSPVSAPTVTPSLQQNEVSFSNGAAPSLDSSSDLTLNAISELSSAADTSLPTSTITTSLSQANTPGTSFQPPSAPEESKIPLAVTESTTSVNHPIQDTNPPEEVAVVVQEMRMETVHSTLPPNSQAQGSSSGTAQVSPSASHTAVERVEYFSKPGILMGEEPSYASSDDLQISRPPTEAAGEQPEEPCSVSSDELMISNASTNTTGSSLTQSAQHPPPACPEVPKEPCPDTHPVAPGNLVLNSTPEENSFSEGDASLSHSQPVEDHYESFCQSLQTEPGTLVNVVQIREEPSFLNLNGQPPSMIGQAVHRNENQASPNHTSATESPSWSVTENQPSLKNQGITQTTRKNEVHTSEQASACAEQEQKEEAQRMLLQPDPRFIAAAAAIGMAAIFIAWKVRH
ncbi:mitochondrial antiviral-signaling protein isoform X2 [Salminus brasiliensis]|uniref:mitochondrial antiviral-signaling protein isoform X2 n=1 Tax=Salminus brasiliensis TaxID=930266 RepID=UPI003B82DFB1